MTKDRIYKISAGLGFRNDVEVYRVGQEVPFRGRTAVVSNIVKAGDAYYRVYVHDSKSKSEPHGEEVLFKEFENKPVTISFNSTEE
jgi:hypothetical protein